ncbi:hypothetical protein [Agrobacterium vitis]|uniref:Apea-like HEPN domain-containing protein n=1 Tax=Agrobacterium vitis TaxID=373 RepID=A0ABW9TKW9_AGRVI|nr:hypothetical protein [Agrobacterium vitis]MUO44710.1 hypothetical protein [Agrobacterium vitis]
MPHIPFDFDPPASPEDDPRFTYSTDGKNTRIRWPLVSVDILYPEHRLFPSIADTVALNAGVMVAHNQMGYSVGQFHEFFVSVRNEIAAAFVMGRIEATFGRATPLAATLFESHRSKYHGDWSEIWTLRLFGAKQEDLEAAVLNALLLYAHEYGEVLNPYPFDDNFDDWDESDDQPVLDEAIHVVAPIVRDLEPLRFYFSGLAQADRTAACIYFYRVIEYYSFLTHENELSRLRHDRSINDQDFSKRVLEVVVKDEKGAVFKLIASLADDELLSKAKASGLIQNTTSGHLADAVYSFRNSIVHGKFSYGFTLSSASFFNSDKAMPNWNGLMAELAKRAIERLGTRSSVL